MTDERIESTLGAYRSGALDRRAFMARLIGMTGSMAAAHLLLESTGFAATVISTVESLLDRASTVIARFRPALHRPAAVDDSSGAERQTADVRPARGNGEAPRPDTRTLSKNEPG